jgi:two-component system, cell cycle sensor histidine kinase and response regulator CckA
MTESTKSVLIVEDETPIRKLLSGVLSPRYRVLQARDAEHALQVANDGSSHLDLLLTDVVMPGMDGFDLADRLRANFPNLQIVFISGFFSTSEFQNRVHQYGAQFLRKPFSIPALLAIVDRVLGLEGGSPLRAGGI